MTKNTTLVSTPREFISERYRGGHIVVTRELPRHAVVGDGNYWCVKVTLHAYIVNSDHIYRSSGEAFDAGQKIVDALLPISREWFDRFGR